MENGDIVKSIWSPMGLMKIVKIEQHFGKAIALIVHINDHPYGYKAGTYGWQYLDYLVPPDQRVVRGCAGKC